MADLSAASLADVSAFFRTYYAPNNASLCLAGDFDPAEAKRLVAKYFGPLPRGPEVGAAEAEVAEARPAPKHMTMTDRVALARATARLADRARRPPGRAGARRARLGPRRPRQARTGSTEALMYDKPLAASASAFAARRSGSSGDVRASTLIAAAAGPGGSTSWSRSPTPRSSGSRPRGRPPTRSSKAQNAQETAA